MQSERPTTGLLRLSVWTTCNCSHTVDTMQLLRMITKPRGGYYSRNPADYMYRHLDRSATSTRATKLADYASPLAEEFRPLILGKYNIGHKVIIRHCSGRLLLLCTLSTLRAPLDSLGWCPLLHNRCQTLV